MPDATQFASYAKLLRLTQVEEIAPSAVARDVATLAAVQIKSRPRRRTLASFALLVIFPTLIVASYFLFFAADRYESEARFVLRMPGRSMASAQLPSTLQSMGSTRANDDGYIVHEFIRSRDALAWLETHADLRKAYAAALTDPIWRFPNPLTSNTEEGLFRHYKSLMSDAYDSTTGVSTLKLQAFSPSDAQKISMALLDAAEGLVNRLNERARQDAIGLSEAEVERAKKRATAAQSALTVFRERERLIDPTHSTLAALETLARLSLESTQVSVQISEVSKASPGAPQMTVLRNRRDALEAQIAIERQRLAGDAQSIAPRIVEYERLMLEREFSERALIAAMTSVEIARNEALRQHVYLERVATPSRPDYPAYPWKVLWCFVTLLAGYMAWRMWCILAADTLEHADT